MAGAPQRKKLYEGKAKVLFANEQNPREVFHYFKDSATAFNAQKKAEFLGKGELNCQISALLFQQLASVGVKSHFRGLEDERTFRTLKLEMIPLEVVVRNRVAGSLAKRTGRREGEKLNPPVVEFFFKDDAAGDPQILRERIPEETKIAVEDVEALEHLALRVNTELLSIFSRAGLSLVDFKLEFGRDPDTKALLLADEISPDTCRLWDETSQRKMDKDLFRFDLGDLLVGYREVFTRLKRVLAEGT